MPGIRLALTLLAVAAACRPEASRRATSLMVAVSMDSVLVDTAAGTNPDFFSLTPLEIPRSGSYARYAVADLAAGKLALPAPGDTAERLFSLVLEPGQPERLAHLRALRDTVGGAASWVGELEGGGAVTFSAVGSSVAGDVWVGDTLYAISPTPDNRHVVQRVDQVRYPPEGQPRGMRPRRRSTVEATLAPRPPCQPTQVDLLVVYPAIMAPIANGDSGIKAMVAEAVTLTNEALKASGLGHTVGIRATVSSDYRPTGNADVDLTALTRGEGQLRKVRELRDTYNADVVILLVAKAVTTREGATCGLGHVISQSSLGVNSAYAIVRFDCARGNLSLAHELGHLFGAEHDRAHAKTQPAGPFAYGYLNNSHRLRDIMAYDCTPPSCARQRQYSNLGWKSPRGFPLGIDPAQNQDEGADVASAIGLTMCDVARYRGGNIAMHRAHPVEGQVALAGGMQEVSRGP